VTSPNVLDYTEPTPGPVPWVHVAGMPLTMGMAGGALVAVDELAIPWGRRSVLDHPQAPTITVSLFDRTRSWALTRDLIGATLNTGFTLADGTVYTAFRGRVLNVEVSPHSIELFDPLTGPHTVHGSLVELTGSSRLVDAGNRRPTAAWPSETLDQRGMRIAALMPGVFTDVLFRPGVGSRVLAAVAADKQVTLLEHLDRMADAAGADRMIHDQNAGRIIYAPRRRYPGTRGFAGLRWSGPSSPVTPGGPSVPRGQGAHLTTLPGLAVPNAVEPSPSPEPSWIDAAACVWQDDTLRQSAANRLSTVQVEYFDTTAAATRRVEVAVAGTDEATEGVRSLSISTDLTTAAAATTCATDVATLAAQEGHTWQLEPFEYRPEHAGMPESQLIRLLFPWEWEGSYFLQRTWLPLYGQRPLFGVIGGVIRYRQGSWRITCNPGPAAPPTVPQHAVTWEELSPPVAAGEPFVALWDTVRPDGLHPSVTFEDLAYAAAGLNQTTIPPDGGYDR